MLKMEIPQQLIPLFLVMAEKYILILEKTVYYRDFAKRMRQIVENPESIDNHPVYGSLKKAYVNTKDVLFN